MRKATLLCWTVFVAAAVLVALTLVACGDCHEKAETRTPTATSPATSIPTPGPNIREIDLSQQPAVKALLQRLGGEVVAEDILYADLTGDGQEEAIVPISSGGTAGNLAFIVLGYRGGELVALLSEVPAEGSVQVFVHGELEDYHLVEVLPVYSPGDTPGFPSQIKKVHYIWKDGALVVGSEEVVENPNAPPKS